MKLFIMFIYFVVPVTLIALAVFAPLIRRKWGIMEKEIEKEKKCPNGMTQFKYSQQECWDCGLPECHLPLSQRINPGINVRPRGK